MPQPSLFARIRHVLLYYVPAITSPLIGYLFRLSPTSSVWDFRTAFMVCVVRAIFNDPTPKSMPEEQQAIFDNLPVPDTM
jgi:hypothetical protein